MKRIIILIAFVLLFGASVACATPAPTLVPPPQPTAASVPTVAAPTDTPMKVDLLPETYPLKDVSMTLERTVCFGTCPSYIVTVNGDGTVNYGGRDFVKVKGAQTRQISQEAVVELLRVFSGAGSDIQHRKTN